MTRQSFLKVLSGLPCLAGIPLLGAIEGSVGDDWAKCTHKCTPGIHGKQSVSTQTLIGYNVTWDCGWSNSIHGEYMTSKGESFIPVGELEKFYEGLNLFGPADRMTITEEEVYGY